MNHMHSLPFSCQTCLKAHPLPKVQKQTGHDAILSTVGSTLANSLSESFQGERLSDLWMECSPSLSHNHDHHLHHLIIHREQEPLFGIWDSHLESSKDGSENSGPKMGAVWGFICVLTFTSIYKGAVRAQRRQFQWQPSEVSSRVSILQIRDEVQNLR